jgi:hypothetical protein
MDNPVSMRVGERGAGLAEHARRERDREWRFVTQHRLERAASDVLHDEVVQPTLVLYPIDGNDPGVVEPGCRLRFPPESRHHRRITGHLGRQNLDRYRAVEREVIGEEDDAHAARAEDLAHLVPTVQGVREPCLKLGERPFAGRLLKPRVGRRALHLLPADEAEPRRVRQRDDAPAALPAAPPDRSVRGLFGSEPIEERHGRLERRPRHQGRNRTGFGLGVGPSPRPVTPQQVYVESRLF